MSLENLLPLGTAVLSNKRSITWLICCRAYRQVRRLTNLGHHEWRQRHGFQQDQEEDLTVVEFTGKLVGFDDYVSE